MMLKRVIALLMAISLTAVLFTACGKKADESSGNTQSASAASSTSEGVKMVGNMYVEGYPIVKDKVTFKAIYLPLDNGGPIEQMEIIQMLEQKTNVHIEWEGIPWASWSEKKNLMFASGDLPDIFYSMDSINSGDIAKYAPQGYFTPLNDLIEKYGPNIKAAFETSPVFKRLCTSNDGKIYSVGRAAERTKAVYNPDMMFIYKPWLDKLNLKVPETVDDFYNVLKAFKTQDPNGNGKADEVPFTFDREYAFGSLFGSFGRIDFNGINIEPGNKLMHFVVDDSKKLVFTADKPEFKKAIEFYSKFFKEGLFDNEAFAAKDATQLISLATSETPVLGGYIGWGPADVYTTPERKNDYVPVAPLKGPEGQQTWLYDDSWFGNISGSGITITNKCKYPDVAVRWLDTHLDKKISAQLFLGAVGATLKEDANGKLEYMDTPQGMNYQEFRFKHAPVSTSLAIFNDDWGKVVDIMPQDRDLLPITEKYYEPYMTQHSVSPLIFNDEESKVWMSTGTDIDNYVTQSFTKWMLKGGIDEEWDSYIQKLKQLGLDNYTDMTVKAYDRWESSMK